MLEIPQKIWKRVTGYTRPQKVFRTNHENVVCWKALRKTDKKPVVIKLFEWEIVEHCADELRAAETLKKIKHKHLVRVLDVVEDEEIGIYYVMEYWGKDLRDTIQIKPDPKVALEIIKQVLEGLAELHRNGLAHRDIKPENICLKDGVVKLGDYGLVKSQRLVTKLITIAGTRNYMAPEVLEGKPYDNRCDIYSVGIVLLELLTQSTDIPKQRPADIHEWFWNKVIVKAIAQDPNERFGSIDDFIKVFAEEVKHFGGIDLRPYRKKRKFHRKDAENAEEKDTPLTPLDRGDSVGTKSPIFQKLDIQRYPPKPEMRGQDTPGVTVETLKPQLDALLKQGDYQSALKVSTEYVRAVEKRFGRQNSRTADAIDILAGIFLRLKNYREASSRYAESLELDKKIYGPTSRQYIKSLYNLAQERLECGDYPASKGYYTEALALTIKGYNEEAIIRNNLAGVHYLLKECHEAIPMYQEAIAINEKTAGKISEAVMINLYNLALTYEAIGKPETAQPFYKQAKEILSKLPPDKLTISGRDKGRITGT